MRDYLNPSGISPAPVDFTPLAPTKCRVCSGELGLEKRNASPLIAKVNQNKLMVGDNYDGVEVTFYIKYCPECGRKLQE